MVKSRSMQRSIVLLIFTILTAVTTFGQQTSTTYTGKLDPDLYVDLVHVYKRVWTVAADTSQFKFSPAVEKEAVVSVGELIDVRKEKAKSTALLVEPPDGWPYLWFDLNENGTYEEAEKFPMAAPHDVPDSLMARVTLPIKNAYYSTFPVYIHYFRGAKDPKLKPTDRLIEQSVMALAMGHVDVKGQKVLFQYPFDPRQTTISTTEGLFGVDINGDDRIRDQQFSPESSYADNAEIVFPLGDGYVSTHSIDVATGKIVVRQREKSEYTRVDLEVGKLMPDFAFTDLEGKERHLKDFRGKYLMVDFWGVWCGDCTRETPFQLSAYAKFKKRRFEILGLDSDEKVETLRAYLSKNNITWPQATSDSVKQLTSVTYRIQEYPSTVLLGPDGKVLVLDQSKLQGEALSKTLDRVLPK